MWRQWGGRVFPRKGEGDLGGGGNGDKFSTPTRGCLTELKQSRRDVEKKWVRYWGMVSPLLGVLSMRGERLLRTTGGAGKGLLYQPRKAGALVPQREL